MMLERFVEYIDRHQIGVIIHRFRYDTKGRWAAILSGARTETDGLHFGEGDTPDEALEALARFVAGKAVLKSKPVPPQPVPEVETIPAFDYVEALRDAGL